MLQDLETLSLVPLLLHFFVLLDLNLVFYSKFARDVVENVFEMTVGNRWSLMFGWDYVLRTKKRPLSVFSYVDLRHNAFSPRSMLPLSSGSGQACFFDGTYGALVPGQPGGMRYGSLL